MIHILFIQIPGHIHSHGCAYVVMQMNIVKIKVIAKDTVEIDTRHIHSTEAQSDLVRKMRASYYLAGALLGRFGCAKVGLPGGCDLGVRPIDLHVKAFEKLGAVVDVDHGCIDAATDPARGLCGKNIYFDRCVSVGATINAIFAAVLAKGTTIIENPAREPHVVDVANFLNTCGARISGAGSDVIKIKGVKDGQIETYPAMGLSLTFDHRVVDGAPAARFLESIKHYIENPVWLVV